MQKTQPEIDSELNALYYAAGQTPQFANELNAAITALETGESLAQVDAEQPRTDDGDKAAAAATQALAWMAGDEPEAFSQTIAKRLAA